MPFCTNCGTSVTAEMAFCPGCGARLAAASAQIVPAAQTAEPVYTDAQYAASG